MLGFLTSPAMGSRAVLAMLAVALAAARRLVANSMRMAVPPALVEAPARSPSAALAVLAVARSLAAIAMRMAVVLAKAELLVRSSSVVLVVALAVTMAVLVGRMPVVAI